MRLLYLVFITSIFLISAPQISAEETSVATGSKIGTVAETMESGGYAYIKLEEPVIWIATAAQPVAVGDTVEYSGGMNMGQFYSRSLDRTFESIHFIQNVRVVNRSIESMHAMGKQSDGAIAAPGSAPVSVESPVQGEIKPLSEGKTVGGIIANSDSLNNQKVKVRVRVMKVSQNIMGKNWVTLSDGTGIEPDNKLIATSQELVSPGDTVIVTGIVRTNVDIGAGYQYEALLEEATFDTVEE